MDYQHIVNMLALNPQLATTRKRSRSSSDSSSGSSSGSPSGLSSDSEAESAPRPPPYKKRAVLSRINEKNKKSYHSGKLYIFDYNPHTDQPGMEGSRNTVHEENCDQMHRFFDENTPYQVRFAPPSAYSSATRFVEWWSNELDSKNDGELVMVYYHGGAYHRDDNYTWTFRKRSLDVSAWDIIKATNQSDCDALFILDCPIATRGKFPTRSRHLTEIIIAGMHMPVDRRGNEVGHNNFTFRFVQHLKDMLEGMNFKFRNWTKTTTLPGLLRADRELASNPIRVWTKGTRKSPQIKYRFVVEPEHMRQNGYLKLFRLRIETPGEETGNGRDEDDESDDDDDFDYGEIEEELTSQRDARKKQSKQTSAKGKLFVGKSVVQNAREMEVDDESNSSDKSSSSSGESTSTDDEHEDSDSDSNASVHDAINVVGKDDGLVASNAPTATKKVTRLAPNAPVAPNKVARLAPNAPAAPNKVARLAPNAPAAPNKVARLAPNAPTALKEFTRLGPFVIEDDDEVVGRELVLRRSLYAPVIDLTGDDDDDDKGGKTFTPPPIVVKTEGLNTRLALVYGSANKQ